VLAAGPDVPPAIARLCAHAAPAAIGVLRERFAALGRVHGLDYAVREASRHEERLQREAAERDAVVDSLRGSLDEVLRHRDSLLRAQALAEERLPVQEAMITNLREALHAAEASLGAARDEAARLAVSEIEHERQSQELRAQAVVDKTELGRLRAEIEALWGNLSAARGDAKAARADAQAEIERRDSEIAALRAAAESAAIAPRAWSGLRQGRH
jgi:chromosome segregation ATPase